MKSDCFVFAAKDRDTLYSQQKQDLLLTVAQISKIQAQIEENKENHQTIQVWPKSNPLWLYSGSDK